MKSKVCMGCYIIHCMASADWLSFPPWCLLGVYLCMINVYTTSTSYTATIIPGVL